MNLCLHDKSSNYFSSESISLIYQQINPAHKLLHVNSANADEERTITFSNNSNNVGTSVK